MCSQSELNILLQKVAAIYQSVYGSDIVKVLMYGSYARGTFDAYSDLDIVAIVKGSRDVLQRKLKDVWDCSCELELEFETILSLAVIPYDEFETYKEDLPYYRNIEREGVAIVT